MNKAKFSGVRIIQNDKVLLVQEKHEEAFGLWSLPLGHVEENENASETAIRESEEETGLEVTLGEKSELEINGLDFKSTSKFNNYLITLTIFDAKITNGTLQKGSDVLDVRWFSLDEIENIPLRGDWVKHFVKI